LPTIPHGRKVAPVHPTALFALLLISIVFAHAAVAGMRSSRGRSTIDGSRAGSHTSNSDATTNFGCCNDADVRNYGIKIDVNAMQDGIELRDQYKSLGVRFGSYASPSAPPTWVDIDYSRYGTCRNVISGDPSFSGWEFFIFANPTQDRWATVQKVGVDIGYCDLPNSCFIAAYDADGQLLDSKFNTADGFQFLGIERQSADIACVLVGDCLGQSTLCQPDQAGSAFNCLTFSTPINGPTPLPNNMPVPPPPTRALAPGASPGGMIALSLILLALGVTYVARFSRSRNAPRA